MLFSICTQGPRDICRFQKGLWGVPWRNTHRCARIGFTNVRAKIIRTGPGVYDTVKNNKEFSYGNIPKSGFRTSYRKDPLRRSLSMATQSS